MEATGVHKCGRFSNGENTALAGFASSERTNSKVQLKKFKDYFATIRYELGDDPAGYGINSVLGYCASEPNNCGATVPLYQLYNNNTDVNDHVLTSDEFERSAMVAYHNYMDLGGWFLYTSKSYDMIEIFLVDCWAWPLEPAWLNDDQADDGR